MTDAYTDSGGEIRPILETMFKSDSFKSARLKKVKSPVELISGVIKLVGTFQEPQPGILGYANTATLMGQQLLDPPTVEGWHTGREWIDGGTLNTRVNFAVNEVGDLSKPGIQDIINKISSEDSRCSPEQLIEHCLDLVGPIEVSPETRDGLLRYATATGELSFESDESKEESATHIGRMLQLIVSTREYQFA